MKKIIVTVALIVNCFFAYSQIDMSKIAIDLGTSSSLSGIGLKLGATYFATEDLEYYGSISIESLYRNNFYQRTAFHIEGGLRYKIAERNRFSLHIGAELSYLYSNTSIMDSDNAHQDIGFAIPLLFRYQLSDRISMEADVGLGFYKSLTSNNYGITPSAGLGFKYRLGKTKRK